MVKRRLKTDSAFRLVPSSPFEEQMIQKAKNERNTRQPQQTGFTKQGALSVQRPNTSVIRKGATRPENGGDLFKALLDMRNDP